MADDFKVGDFVRSKSCLGKMTITQLGRWNNSDRDQARCTWLDGPIRKWDIFDLNDLEKTVPSKRTRMIWPEEL
jgi:uncharacterized protein YodC (DUF2158 family)